MILKKTIIIVFMSIILLISFCSCQKNCNHTYYVHKTVEATCTEEGYNEYKCSECGDKYKETISAKGHTPGEAPTFDTAQVCVDCGTVLAGTVDYMPYRANDLAINQYYGYGNSYITTEIISQNLDRLTSDSIPYTDKHGVAYPLHLDFPIQDFFKHSVNSVLPVTTSDGKTYSTNSGFKLSFSFTPTDIDVKSIHAWEQGLSKEFKNTDADLLKIVGVYRANPSFYNNIYELVDFSDCCIEVAKKTATGYKIVKKIDSPEDWKAILQAGGIEISNDNGELFYEVGTYRILFKYNMTWITDPPSAVYLSKDFQNALYPYGKLNDQYEFFYITVTEERNNILLPGNVEASDWGFFCQLRAPSLEKNASFIKDHSVLTFENDVAFKVGAKVDMTKTDYYYNGYAIENFSFTLSKYNAETDTYDEYKAYDLMPSISRDIVYGEEITVDVGKDAALRDQKCKITLSYSFIDEATGETITEQQNYYYTLLW